MATGVSKTKWNGELIAEALGLGESSFHPIWTGGNSPNRLYYGDSLSVLQDLVRDDSIREKVRLIYIDPPYATNSVFQTKKMCDAYTDLLTGDEYINFMWERLVLLREILSNDGSIYVHLDSNMVFRVKVLMDQLFGERNFRAMITRKKCKSKNYTKNTYGNVADYILFYTRSVSAVWNRQYEEWSNEKISKEYPFVEETTRRRYKRVPHHAPGVRNGETVKMWRGMLPPQGKHWQFTPNKLEELDKRGEIHWSKNGNPRRKIFLDKSNGLPIQDIWMDFVDSNNQNTQTTGYPTEKNLDMLKRIILASSNEGDLVLDCFAGSGTTLVAAHELKRNWIGVDIGNEAIKVILNRFQNGTQTLDEHLNGNNEKKSDELPLFDVSDTPPPTISHPNPIRDFSIYANGNYSEEAFSIPT